MSWHMTCYFFPSEETITTTIQDLFPKVMKKMRVPITLGCCLVLFLLGLVCVTQVYYRIFHRQNITWNTYLYVTEKFWVDIQLLSKWENQGLRGCLMTSPSRIWTKVFWVLVHTVSLDSTISIVSIVCRGGGGPIMSTFLTHNTVLDFKNTLYILAATTEHTDAAYHFDN